MEYIQETKLKVPIIAVCVASLSGLAHAQSTVTLYGRIDAGVQFQTGLPHGSAVSAESGNYGESFFGLRGVEDLGAGNRAIFRLEGGFNAQSGTILQGGIFGHTATVGLSNDSFGTVNLGNFGAREMEMWGSFDVDPQVMQTYAISTLVRGRNWSKAGSGIEYTSPSFGGLVLKGQYDLANSTSWNGNGGLGSGPGNLGGAQGRSNGVQIQYTGANFELVAIYDEIRDPDGQFSNVYVASRSILGGATVTLGPVKLFAGVQHLSAPDASNAGYFGTAVPPKLPAGTSLPTTVNHGWIGAEWQVSSSVDLNAAVYHANANNGNGNATMYTLAGQYHLSKRTFLYTELGYVRNSATSNIGLGNGYTNPYGPNSNDDPINGRSSSAPDYGRGQFGAFTGIMTYF